MRYGTASKALLAALLVSLAACDGRPLPAAWRLTRDGVSFQDPVSLQRFALDLPGWQWAEAPYACMPALALGPKGEAIVTSNVMPVVWRIDPQTRAVTMHPLALDADTDKDVGFSSLAYSAKHGAFFAVSDIQGSVWRIDASLRRAQKVAYLPVAPCTERPWLLSELSSKGQ
jgi:hypothetical protein